MDTLVDTHDLDMKSLVVANELPSELAGFVQPSAFRRILGEESFDRIGENPKSVRDVGSRDSNFGAVVAQVVVPFGEIGIRRTCTAQPVTKQDHENSGSHGVYVVLGRHWEHTQSPRCPTIQQQNTMRRSVGIVSIRVRHAVSGIAAAIVTSLTFGQGMDPTSQRLLERVQSHKQLVWKGAGGCVVNVARTPCRTVRSHEFSFGGSLGFDGITASETIEAFDQDGSTSKTYSAARWRPWHLPEPTAKGTHVVLRTEDRTLFIDHDRAEFLEYRGGSNRMMPYWEEDDSVCSHAKSHFHLEDRLPDAVVAGVRVVGYSSQDFRGADYEVYFAPSLGCQQMRLQLSMRTFFGVKKAQYEMVVDSLELGAPERRLFTVPSGFRRVDSIALR